MQSISHIDEMVDTVRVYRSAAGKASTARRELSFNRTAEPDHAASPQPLFRVFKAADSDGDRPFAYERKERKSLS
jgi:hypothetical protein